MPVTLPRLPGPNALALDGAGRTVLFATGSTAAFADGAHAYLVGVEEPGGRRPRDADQLLFQSDGDRVEPLLSLRDPALGMGDAAVVAFGVGTEVFDTDNSFYGGQPFDFTLHREGLLGDALSLMDSFGSSRRPIHRLCTNVPFQAGTSTPRWAVGWGSDRTPMSTLEGRPGIRHRNRGNPHSSTPWSLLPPPDRPPHRQPFARRSASG